MLQTQEKIKAALGHAFWEINSCLGELLATRHRLLDLQASMEETIKDFNNLEIK